MFEVSSLRLMTKTSNVKPATSNDSARVLGFEPRLKVLETSVLPLYYTRMKAKSYSVLPKQLLAICCKDKNLLHEANRLVAKSS